MTRTLGWLGASVVACTVVALAGCEPRTQMRPSAVQMPAPPATVPAAPVTAAHGMGADMATVQASVHAQPAHDESGDSASPLGALRSYVGQHPSESNVSFLERGVLAERLKRLLGRDYAHLLANLRTVGPLTEDGGLWFITGNRPHEGGTEAAAVVVDAAQNAVRVWMLHEGQVTTYQDPLTVNVPWPREVRQMVDQYAGRRP